MSGVLEITDLARTDAWLHARVPSMPSERRIRLAALITVERRGETLTEAEVDAYLIPAPYLPPDDDEARTAQDADDRHRWRDS